VCLVFEWRTEWIANRQLANANAIGAEADDAAGSLATILFKALRRRISCSGTTTSRRVFVLKDALLRRRE
jgi:hypothetical protein